MSSKENHIPGIEIITPTIFSAKSAAREYVEGKDNRSPLTLLKELAVAYVSLHGAETRQESHMGTYGRKQPPANPWKVDYMRTTTIREVAFETEAGPTGIRLSERSDRTRRPYKPAIRCLGAIAFMDSEASHPTTYETLTLMRPSIRGGSRKTTINIDPWVEIGESPGFIDFVFGDTLVEMLEFPDEPKPIVPFPDEMRKK